jgi:hypothetical protein
MVGLGDKIPQRVKPKTANRKLLTANRDNVDHKCEGTART